MTYTVYKTIDIKLFHAIVNIYYIYALDLIIIINYIFFNINIIKIDDKRNL